jgi:hypothetical protein
MVPEVTMTALSLHQRPVPLIAAAAAVVAIAAGSLAMSVADRSNDPGAPGQPAQVSGGDTPQAHHFHPTTSGGHVMPGE